jgi:hypothetical protein
MNMTMNMNTSAMKRAVAVAGRAVRGLSTPAKPAALTPEVYTAAMQKVEKHKTFLQKTCK